MNDLNKFIHQALITQIIPINYEVKMIVCLHQISVYKLLFYIYIEIKIMIQSDIYIINSVPINKFVCSKNIRINKLRQQSEQSMQDFSLILILVEYLNFYLITKILQQIYNNMELLKKQQQEEPTEQELIVFKYKRNRSDDPIDLIIVENRPRKIFKTNNMEKICKMFSNINIEPETLFLKRISQNTELTQDNMLVYRRSNATFQKKKEVRAELIKGMRQNYSFNKKNIKVCELQKNKMKGFKTINQSFKSIKEGEQETEDYYILQKDTNKNMDIQNENYPTISHFDQLNGYIDSEDEEINQSIDSQDSNAQDRQQNDYPEEDYQFDDSQNEQNDDEDADYRMQSDEDDKIQKYKDSDEELDDREYFANRLNKKLEMYYKH